MYNAINKIQNGFTVEQSSESAVFYSTEEGAKEHAIKIIKYYEVL